MCGYFKLPSVLLCYVGAVIRNVLNHCIVLGALSLGCCIFLMIKFDEYYD